MDTKIDKLNAVLLATVPALLILAGFAVFKFQARVYMVGIITAICSPLLLIVMIFACIQIFYIQLSNFIRVLLLLLNAIALVVGVLATWHLFVMMWNLGFPTPT